jgi:hypothetical protein
MQVLCNLDMLGYEHFFLHNMLYGILLSSKVPIIWVVDRHRFDADEVLDPGHPTFYFDADPDPDPTPRIAHVGKFKIVVTFIHRSAS